MLIPFKVIQNKDIDPAVFKSQGPIELEFTEESKYKSNIFPSNFNCFVAYKNLFELYLTVSSLTDYTHRFNEEWSSLKLRNMLFVSHFFLYSDWMCKIWLIFSRGA
ncbi:hypothetical protein HZS_5450 [Henneguya salminicola]|nr:hypothetical protein HZS_5450 [Henneguya salminicola]